MDSEEEYWERHKDFFKDERSNDVMPCYFQIVNNNYSLCKQLEEEGEKLKAKQSENDYLDNYLDRIERTQQKRNYKIQVIIFSALVLEVIINDYGASNLSDAYFKKYIDKLNVKSKWVVIPRLVNNKEFPTDSLAFELLGKLIKLRNNLVHHKTSKYPNTFKAFKQFIKKNKIEMQDVDDAYNCVLQCLIELKKIHGDGWQILDYIAMFKKAGNK